MTDASDDPGEAYRQLKPAKRQFVDEVVAGAVQTDAARTVWPKSKRPDVKASKLMAEPLVRTAVEQRKMQAAIDAGVEAAKVLKGIADIAYDANSTRPDRLRAFELLGRNLKLWTEKHEHTGKDGTPLAAATQPVLVMLPEQVKEIARALLAGV